MSEKDKTEGLHHSDALLLIDVINDFDFPDARRFVPKALAAAKMIARLRARAKRAKVPVIYVNDNFGRWRSDFRQQVEHCMSDQSLGREVATLLRPTDEDIVVIKPMHSGFYSTTLDVLLKQIGAQRLILCGFVTDICILYTANDAYMRGYQLVVPGDCTATETLSRRIFAITHMREQLKADTAPSKEIKF